jgi:hypothetical protein
LPLRVLFGILIFNIFEPTQRCVAITLQYGATKKVVTKCMCSGNECQLLGRGGQTKQLEMLMTVLPNVKNEQLLFVNVGLETVQEMQ